MKNSIKLISPIVIFAFAVVPSKAFAASSVICYNTSSKAITVEAKCGAGRTQITGANISTLTGSKIVNYSKCYTQSGKNAGSNSSGRLAVALSCRAASDVVVNDSFDPEENPRAEPSLGSKTLIFTKGTSQPNGVQFEAQATPNTYYSVSASIVCCPQS